MFFYGLLFRVLLPLDFLCQDMGQIINIPFLVGLTRGMGPQVLHSACFSALGYFSFETTRLSILREYLRRKELGEREIEVPVSDG